MVIKEFKSIKKALKIFSIVLLVILLIISSIWGIFQIPRVQTYAAQKAANYFSEKLNTPITIKSLEVDFWNKIILKKFYIEDLNQDTLVYLETLTVNVEGLNYRSKGLTMSVELTQPVVNLYQRKGESEFNYEFISNYFSQDSSSETSSDWNVTVKGVTVEQGTFRFHDFDEEPVPYGVDYFHTEVRDLRLNAKEFIFDADTIVFRLNSLSLKDVSGFQLDNLSANSMIYPGGIFLKKMNIHARNTDLNGEFSMLAENFSDYGDFIDKVQMKSNFESTLIHVTDLAYFVPQLKGVENYVYLEGEINGTVSNLKGKNVEIIINKETFLTGDFAFRGLPDFTNTFISLELEEFRTSAKGLRKIPYPPFENRNTMDVPENLNLLGNINFKGNFTGYPSDFVAYGQFETALGGMNTDLLMKKDDRGLIEYKGKINSKEFKLGELLGQNELGSIGLNVRLNGSGLTKETASLSTEGAVKFIEYKGYRYSNISVNGSFNKEQFTGNLGVNDKNLKSEFTGIINISESTPVSQFKLIVKEAKLAKLNLFNQKDTSTTLIFNSNVDIKGKNIDDFSGRATINNLSYRDKRLDHKIDNFELIADRKGGKRNIELFSSFLDAKMLGDYKIMDLTTLYNNYVNNFFPDSNYVPVVLINQDFIVEARLKDTKPITEVLLPELSIDSGLELKAKFNSKNYFAKIVLGGNRLKYEASDLRNFDLNIDSEKDSIHLQFSSESLSINGSQKFKGLSIRSKVENLTNNNLIQWDQFGDKIGEGRLKIMNEIESFYKMNFTFVNSYFNVSDSIWRIDSGNAIVLDSGNFDVTQLSLGNQLQHLQLGGKVSSSQSDTLDIELTNIDLAFITSLLPENTVNLRGEANGSSSIVGVYKDLSLTTNLELTNLFINDVEIGRSNLKSTWDSESKSLLVDGNLGDKESDILRLNGSVFPLKEENSLELVLEFNQFPLELIRPYIEEYITDVAGNLNGKVDVSGEAEAPLLKGVLDLQETKFHVNYLNTDYTVDDKIIFEPDFIGFNLIKIFDSEKNPAIATGTVFHENYSNFNFDIGLEFNNFLSLNTTANDNNLYYGRGVTSGTANLSGYADQLIIELDVKTERGTDFKIPLEEGVDVSNSDFLVFTNSPEYNKGDVPKVDLSGIQMNFDLEITPDAKLQIIFDEQVGDIIRGTGDGSLKLEINTIGDFNIYGQYLVTKGDYLFTLQNVINKRFDIAAGSSIYWDGSPYEAVLDIRAIYNLRAPLYDLFPNDTTNNYKRRTPVELELQLTDYLLNPDINFDIRLPSADENTKRQLESVLFVNSGDVNLQEMNQQVLGLLVFNRFVPTASTGGGDGYNRGTPGLNIGYEFVSNQLSNWFSQLSDQFDVGVNYRPGDDLNSDELDLSLSTEVFNNRLLLDGNVGYSGDNPQVTNQNSNFIGEFTAEYKLSRDGRYRVKGFNRSVTNSLLQLNSPYTQGVGLFYREEFDTAGELWRKYFGKRK